MAHKKNPFLGWEIETAPQKSGTAPHTQPCAHLGCPEAGTFPGPASPYGERSQRRFFCTGHIQEYNQDWNYYAGMSQVEIEEDQRKDRLWRRTTQPMRVAPQDWLKFLGNVSNTETIDALLGRIHHKNAPQSSSNPLSDKLPNTVKEALAVLQLSWPCTALTAKQHYKKLVKMLHPDIRGSDADAEEAMKRVNVAYALLRRFLGGKK